MCSLYSSLSTMSSCRAYLFCHLNGLVASETCHTYSLLLLFRRWTSSKARQNEKKQTYKLWRNGIWNFIHEPFNSISDGQTCSRHRLRLFVCFMVNEVRAMASIKSFSFLKSQLFPMRLTKCSTNRWSSTTYSLLDSISLNFVLFYFFFSRTVPIRTGCFDSFENRNYGHVGRILHLTFKQQ